MLPWAMGIWRHLRVLLALLFFAFLPRIFATLPPEEIGALCDIYLAANIPWDESQDPCTVQAGGFRLQCSDDHVTHLFLRDGNVIALPECISQLQALKYLDLSDNLLTSLPESVGQLRNLSVLDLEANLLTSLPESFGQLRNLSFLHLEGNLLTSLPESFGQLHTLAILHLSVNLLTSLPEPLWQLHNLSILKLDGNRLRSLPESIGQLQELSVLSLENNKLASLPESLGQLQNLRELHVASNQLVLLPESIGQLQTLAILHLSVNLLTSLPESLGQLRNLSILHLEGNLLRSLPESIGQLQKLWMLSLENNKLASLPESLGQLQNLRELHVASNQLVLLPESIGQLHKLYRLRLGVNRLTSLPESIGQLQDLINLDLTDNFLTSLPQSIGQLQELTVLFLDSNRLASLPEVIGQLPLRRLDAARNQLISLPKSLGKAAGLDTINMHSNFITELPESLGNLSHLAVVNLHSNRLHDALELCKLRNNAYLNSLFLHDNALQGHIPSCLNNFRSLVVLTLHGNALTGSIPRAFVLPQNITLLTLHDNQLRGVIPEDFAGLRRLSFFSAHSNDLEGSIPSLKLKNDCVDDMSFVLISEHFAHRCGDYSGLCKIADFRTHCPKACGLCNATSCRGPVLLVHDNRLSCKLPQDVTEWPEEMRSISLIGNRLGDGQHTLPSWIQTDERQPFLYVSNNKTIEIFKRTMLYAILFVVSMLHLLVRARFRRTSEAGTPLTHKAHRFLLQMSIALSAVGAVLLSIYCYFATYYVCNEGFFSSNLSHFSKPGDVHAIAEWALTITWTVWILVAAFFLRRAPKPEPDCLSTKQEVTEVKLNLSFTGLLQKSMYSLCWLCIVTILSFPSIFYSIADSMPSNNTLGVTPWWQRVLHYQAPLITVLLDIFVTPRAVAKFSAFSGVRRSMLLIATRLVTMWLAASLTTLYLSPHCINGWTSTWKVCDEHTTEYEALNITFGDTQILEPKADLCAASKSWWSEDKCMRSLVDTMAPLLLSKMIARAFLQPVITLVKWQLSHYHDGQLYLRKYLLFGNPFWCTSNSLEQGRQACLLVTFAEVALLWGPFVPLLLPAVILATGTNMLVCQIGHGCFAVEHRTVDITPIGISRRYLHGTLIVALLFQNWFAWTSEMRGKWLLLVTACIYAIEVGASVITGKRASKSRANSVITVEMNEISEDFLYE